MARKKMNEKEKQDWEDLYYYVKNIMGYDENQSLSNTMVLRLKGLSTNKFIENKNVKSTANYSYETILNAFKYSSLDIQRALRTNSFKDEMHRFNYLLKIVEKNIKDKTPVKVLAEEYKVSVSSLSSWVAAYKRYGESGLVDRRYKNK